MDNRTAQLDRGLRVPTDLAARLEPLVADAVAGAGFELDALEVQQAGRRKLVKVVVDSEDGVELDQIADVSRAVSAELDANDAVLAGAYTLEVTSPGLSRPLTKPRHWRRAKFRLVKITPHEGEPYVARVGKVSDKKAKVLVNGEMREVAYDDVAKAVVQVEFKQPPADELKRLQEEDGR